MVVAVAVRVPAVPVSAVVPEAVGVATTMPSISTDWELPSWNAGRGEAAPADAVAARASSRIVTRLKTPPL